MDNIFFDIGLIIIIATMAAYLARLFKQPLIPAYILSGIIIGPILKLVTDTATIMTLSEIGIAFLLFIVGLEIDFRKIGNVAKLSIIGGLSQMILIFNFGFLTAIYMGFKKIEAIYFGLILTFSSTAVVLKLLSDKNELDTLHARIVIGFLLIEDIVVVFVLSILNSINNFSFYLFGFSILKGGIVIIGAILASKYIFPKLFKFAAKDQELLFLLSISVLFVFSMIFHYIGFSIVIGSFIAGVVLANLPYHIEIMSKVESLKDFFATIFFVSLGLDLVLDSVKGLILPLIIFFLFVTFIKPLITMVICSFFGYTKRPSFLASISLTQISEFSLIIVSQGLILGHISKDVFSMTVLLMMGTVTTTSYFIKYDNKLFKMIGNKINFFENVAVNTSKLENIPKRFKPDYILCGYNRIGYSILKSLRKKNKKVLVVDFNPEVIKELLKKRNIKCLYGDIGDSDLLTKIGLDNTKFVISTDPNVSDNKLLIKKTKAKNKSATIILTANHIDEAIDLYNLGADYVVMPHLLGGEHVSLILDDFEKDMNKFIKTKKDHIKELMHRKRMTRVIQKKK